MATTTIITTNLITGDGYRVFRLREPLELATVASHPEIAYLAGQFNPPAPGQLMNNQTRVPHAPYSTIYSTPDEVLAHPEHRGECRPVYAVRPVYGGGYVEDAPDWLRTGEPVAWIHDTRFHWGCPEA